MQIKTGTIPDDIASNVDFEVLQLEDILSKIVADTKAGKTVAVWQPAYTHDIPYVVSNENILRDGIIDKMVSQYTALGRDIAYFVLEKVKIYMWVKVLNTGDDYYDCRVLVELKEDEIIVIEETP